VKKEQSTAQTCGSMGTAMASARNPAITGQRGEQEENGTTWA